MKSLIFNLFCQSCDKVLVGVFIMTFTIFGLSFLIQAVFNALGKNTFLGKEYRNSEKGRIYQLSMVFPLMILGCGWSFLGTIYYAVYQGNDSTSFYIWLAVVTIPIFIWLAVNKYKFKKRF